MGIGCISNIIMNDCNILADSKKIILRDRVSSDVDSFINWQTCGEWLKYDAPWESTEKPDKDLKVIREKFVEVCLQKLPIPRKSAFIADKHNKPIGWVNRYSHKNSADAWLVGIDICEDDYLNKGYGTIALALWTDYLFRNSTFHRIGLETWSFNNRMIEVAQKAGFALEGTQRKIRRWKGEWLDLLHFVVFREEWGKWGSV